MAKWPIPGPETLRILSASERGRKWAVSAILRRPRKTLIRGERRQVVLMLVAIAAGLLEVVDVLPTMHRLGAASAGLGVAAGDPGCRGRLAGRP